MPPSEENRALAAEILTEFAKYGRHAGFRDMLALRLDQLENEWRYKGYVEGFAEHAKITDKILEMSTSMETRVTKDD
jgi:hypothetical protein